jgi:hypothetical protein
MTDWPSVKRGGFLGESEKRVKTTATSAEEPAQVFLKLPPLVASEGVAISTVLSSQRILRAADYRAFKR